MSFTVVSERLGVTSRDSREKPEEALLLATALVRSGAEKVWVYDASGQFLSASALSEIARQRVETERAPKPAGADSSVDLLAREGRAAQGRSAAGSTATISPDARLSEHSTARVFRMAIPRT